MEVPIASQVIGVMLEIGLTVAAWRRGWHKTALLPVAIFYAVSSLFGFVAGVSGGTVDRVLPLITLIGFVKLGSLVWMISHPRHSPQVVSQPEATSSPELTKAA